MSVPCEAAVLLFQEKFVGKQFLTFKEFEISLKSYMNSCNAHYVRASSVKSQNHHLRYDRVTFCCNRRAPRKS